MERLPKFKQLQDLKSHGQRFGQGCQKQLIEEKNINGLLKKKTKLDNARKLRGIQFLDLEDVKFMVCDTCDSG